MVMKGCQKRIIVMKNTGSNLFDEAYFILKDSAVRSPSISEQDMVGEAARIIAENMIVSERRDTKPRRRSGDPELYMLLRWYVAGVITAALICIAIVLFL
ncbi:MAG: hypothetical protein ACOYID_02435 [Eubacteriales bacterium]